MAIFYPDGQEIDNNTDPNDSDDPGAFVANLAHRYSFNSGAEIGRFSGRERRGAGG